MYSPAPITIQAIGGIGSHPIVIGGRTEYAKMDRRDKWRAHKQFGNKDYTVKTVNEILMLPEYIDDKRLLIDVLNRIWNAPVEQIFTGIAKSAELDEPINVARRTLFWKLKEFIEALLTLYLKHVHGCNVKQVLAEWKKYVQKNHIDTSSIILWTLFGHKSEIKPPKVKEQQYVANIRFSYLGYCPNVPNERIRELLKFPVDELISELTNHIKIPVEFAKITQMLEKYVSDHHKSNVQSCKKAPLKPNKDFYKYIDSFMEEWLTLIDCLNPHLEGLEHHYIDKAQKMDELNKELEKLVHKLLANI